MVCAASWAGTASCGRQAGNAWCDRRPGIHESSSSQTLQGGTRSSAAPSSRTGRPRASSRLGPTQTVVTRRKCRDVLFLCFFLCFVGGMVYVCIQAFQQGDPRRLYYGIDSYGNVCGANNAWGGGSGPDLRDAKKLLFLDPFQLHNPLQLPYAKAVCVAECPAATDVCDLAQGPCLCANQYRCPYYAVAEDGLAGTLTGVTDARGVTDPWSTDYWAQLATTTAPCDFDAGVVPPAMQAAFGLGGGTCGAYYQALSQAPGEGPCYPVWTESVEFLNRCLPKFPEALQEELGSGLGALTGVSLNNSRDRLTRYIGDIGRGLYLILAAGLGVGLFFSVFWLVLLRYFAGFMTWLTVLAVNLLFAGCTLLCYQKAGMLTSWGQAGAYIASELADLGQDPSEEDRQAWAYVAYAMSGVTAVLLLWTLVMVPRLKVAIAVMKVASQAVSAVPTVFLFPVVPFLATVGFTAYWCVVAAYLWSAGDINPHLRDPAEGGTAGPSLNDLLSLATGGALSAASVQAASGPTPPSLTDASCANNPDCYYSIDWNTTQRYLFIFHLFSLLWVLQFIVGFGHISIAGAIAHFYWSRGDTARMPRAPLLLSVGNALSYHLGSVALGSFVIAVMQFVRIVFEFVAARLRKLTEKSWLQFLVCLVRGLLWLLEAILKFVNRNAFIMVAVKGKSYCASAGRAATLLVANALRVGAVNTVGDFLLWLGKLAVAAGCGVVALLLRDPTLFTDPVNSPDTYLTSPILPVAVSVGVGWTVAHIFMQVYEMAVDTILLCFCEDCEANQGHPQHAPELLQHAIGLAHGMAAGSKVVDDSNHGGAFIVSKGAGATPAAARPPAAGDDWEIRATASSRV